MANKRFMNHNSWNFFKCIAIHKIAGVWHHKQNRWRHRTPWLPGQPNELTILSSNFYLVSHVSTINEKIVSKNLGLCSIMTWKILLPGVHLHHDRAEQGQRPGEQLQGGFQVSDHIAAVTKLPKKRTVCKLSDYTVSQIQTQMTKAEAETNRQIIHIVRSSD